MYVVRRFHFDAAHRLPNYDGKCADLHGHRWEFDVGLTGKVDPETGMVIDFGIIKEIVNDKVVSVLDHKYLNDIVENPTAENLVWWISNRLKPAFDYVDLPVSLLFVRLYESPDCYVEVWR